MTDDNVPAARAQEGTGQPGGRFEVQVAGARRIVTLDGWAVLAVEPTTGGARVAVADLRSMRDYPYHLNIAIPGATADLPGPELRDLADGGVGVHMGGRLVATVVPDGDQAGVRASVTVTDDVAAHHFEVRYRQLFALTTPTGECPGPVLGR